jgi:hypothetical protein
MVPVLTLEEIAHVLGEMKPLKGQVIELQQMINKHL